MDSTEKELCVFLQAKTRMLHCKNVLAKSNNLTCIKNELAWKRSRSSTKYTCFTELADYFTKFEKYLVFN